MIFHITELFPDVPTHPTCIQIETNSYVWKRLSESSEWTALSAKHDQLLESSKRELVYDQHLKSLERVREAKTLRRLVKLQRAEIGKLKCVVWALITIYLITGIGTLVKMLLSR